MLCCFESSQRYSTVNQDEDLKSSTLHDGWTEYPAASLRSIISNDAIPDNPTWIKTGGNALQAMSLGSDKDVIVVTVTGALQEGNTILVTAPDGRVVHAVIPQGCQTGHSFLVHMDPPVEPQSHPVIVTGVPLDPNLATKQQHYHDVVGVVDQNQVIANNNTNNANNNNANNTKIYNCVDAHGFVLVKVPIGAVSGDKIRVRLVDKREFTATVPRGLETSDFYVKAPPKQQNWHDNPLAYGAPMIVGPMLL